MKNIILVPLLLLSLTHVFCQVEDSEKEFQTRKITSRTFQSSSSSGFFSANNFTKLNATNDGVSAEANIDYSLKTWNLNLNASTPVSSKSQRVKPLTIAGLSNNSSLILGAQKIIWGKGFNWNAKSFDIARRAIGKDTVVNFKTKNLTEEEKVKFYELADIDWGTAIFFSGKFGMEQQTFNYVTDPGILTNEESSKTAVNLSASFGIMPKWGILAISYTHSNGYQADEPIKYYIPINSSGAQIEKDLSSSPPTHLNSDKLRIEFLSLGKPKIKEDQIIKSPFRINPNVNFELNQHLFSFEFPVYFLTSDSEKTNFNGGIYAGYVSDKNFKFNTNKNNFGFGVFIGANFTKIFQ